MASQNTNDSLVKDIPVPDPAKPLATPAAVDPARDLRDEKVKEQAAERAEAAKKRPAFMARKLPAPGPRPEANAEYETLLFASAANNPLQDLNDYTPSTFIPFCGTLFYLLMYMDHTMAGTRKFTDNCHGWVPPISQMYVSLLLYVQILRAKDAAGNLRANDEEFNFLTTFMNVFPLSELWIPGPLVAFFRNVSAFWPSQDDFFGNVSPTIPAHPGWTKALFANLASYQGQTEIINMLPNPSFFISRLRSICAISTTANLTQNSFSSHVNGPNYCSQIFGTQLSNTAAEQWLMCSPGAKFAYPDNLQLWQNAAAALNRNSIPRDFDFSAAPTPGRPTTPKNSWPAFFRFDQIDNEYMWFAPVSAIMALYSKFFHGSTNLESIHPNCSAAPAIKMVFTTKATLLTTPDWEEKKGDGGKDANDGTNSDAHYVLENNAEIVFNASNALKGVPAANQFAGLTYNINLVPNSKTMAFRQGPFWTLAPDVQSRNGMNIIPGVLSSIMRDYHSPVALAPGK